MALCLPRRRRATSLATLPRTLSVASITNHSCFTSAGFALKVFISVSHGRFGSTSAVGAPCWLPQGVGPLRQTHGLNRLVRPRFPRAVRRKAGDDIEELTI